MVLHAAGTVVALFLALRLVAANPMWMKAVVYVAAWAACAFAYLLVLLCWEQLLAFFDARVRAVVRDERTVEDLRTYRRRLRFVRSISRRRSE